MNFDPRSQNDTMPLCALSKSGGGGGAPVGFIFKMSDKHHCRFKREATNPPLPLKKIKGTREVAHK